MDAFRKKRMSSSRRTGDRQSALPYTIPGPAGNLGWGAPDGHHVVSDSPIGRRRIDKRDNPIYEEQRFLTPPWQAMLQHLELIPYGGRTMDTSIAQLRCYALHGVFDKVSVVSVRVESLTYVGKDASVILADPTARISATVHAEVFAHRKGQVEIGAVLVLQGVTALAYTERKPTGFRTDVQSSLHISVQPSNILHIFPVSTKIPLSLSKQEAPVDSSKLKSAYTNEALRPLPPPRLTTPRRQMLVEPSARPTPLASTQQTRGAQRSETQRLPFRNRLQTHQSSVRTLLHQYNSY